MKDCWVITDGNAGARSQAIGLVESLGIQYEEKIFRLRSPYRIFAPYFNFDYIKYKTESSSDLDLNNPPKIVIVCGSSARSIGPFLKRKFAEKIFTIYIQDPKISASYYDLIISPKHDRLRGENILNNFFALNRITKEKLEEEKSKFSKLFERYSSPFNTILIGGNTKKYKMSEYACEKLISDVKEIIKCNNGSFLITPSRRTPKKIVDALHKIESKKIYLYDLKSKQNPFFAMLALANRVFVTNDSVSMVSEAVATGKPVYALMLHGHNNTKVARMFYNLVAENKINIFDGKSEKKHEISSSTNEVKEIASKVKNIILEKGLLSKEDFHSNA